MRDASVPAQACANCDTPFDTPAAPPRYCPQCGQETTLHPPSVAEFAHEFVGHYVALEGPLWKTLGLLLFRPGRLTSEYLRGRRRRYVPCCAAARSPRSTAPCSPSCRCASSSRSFCCEIRGQV
jgi:hypothetical protein